MNSVEEVLQRNDLVYDVLPPRWAFGLPIGNGEVGGMVWVRDGTQLIITLDHVWAWDNRSHPLKDPDRFNYQSFRAAIEAHDKSFLDIIPFHHHWHLPAKTHVGRVVIDFGQRISGTARLDLINAEVSISLQTESVDTFSISVLALADRPVIVIDHPQTCIKEIRLERLGTETVGLHDAPEHIHDRSESVEWIRQDIPENSSIVIGLRRGETQSFTTVQVTRSGIDPVEEAVNVLERASVTPDEHLENHRAGWGRFWDKSGVQVPDEKIESLWYMGLYMLASSSRENGCAASLHGLWSPDSCIPPPPHGFYIWDFYSQHWGLYTANHLELGEAFCDHFLSILPRLKEQTRQFYGWDGVFVPGVMIVDGSWIFRGCNEVLLWPGATAWVAQAFWWQYLYSHDIHFLRERAYPFMRECILFYERLLEKGEDGKYHLYTRGAPQNLCDA